jgi:hypothetical protein
MERWIVLYIVRPPLLLLGFILKPVGLLLGILDRPLARRDERKLRRDIAEAMPFLFKERQGRIVSNEGVPFPPSFDYAFVTVQVENLFTRFCRGRGELDLHIGCTQQPRDLHELGLVLSLLDEHGGYQRWGIANLGQAGRTLESKMDLLTRAFGKGMDKDLARRLREVALDDRIAIREAEWEINRRLRPRQE